MIISYYTPCFNAKISVTEGICGGRDTAMINEKVHSGRRRVFYISIGYFNRVKNIAVSMTKKFAVFPSTVIVILSTTV